MPQPERCIPEVPAEEGTLNCFTGHVSGAQGWVKIVPAWAAEVQVQGVWQGRDMCAWKGEEHMQGVRQVIVMPTQMAEVLLQGLRWVRNMLTQTAGEPVQGLRWVIVMPTCRAEALLQGVRWVRDMCTWTAQVLM